MTQTPLSDLTLLVIHYRTPELLRRCLAHLERFATGARIVVVDSSPPGETPAFGPDSAVQVVSVPNHSFAQALNVGLELAHTPYIAHMNADVFVAAETFPALLGVLKQPGVGLVGPRVKTPAGTWQQQGVLYRRHYARLGRTKSVPGGAAAASLRVPWLSGCLQVVRTEAVAAVGGMDASLRFYNEDLEWCLRLTQAGWACRLVTTDVLHLGGSATPKDPRFWVEGYRGGYKLSQRYHGAVYQRLHRSAVRLEAAWQHRFARDPLRRSAAAQIGEMFRRGAFDESPFGETLDSDNPLFLLGDG